MSQKPQLGHYRVAVATDEAEVLVIPVNPQQPTGILLWISKGGKALVAELSYQEARKIAQGLMVCAERVQCPDAVAGPEAWT